MNTRRAFTLIELLVVLAVVAILLALAVPAVMRFREAAARTECQTKLRELALACHAYHQNNHKLPAGATRGRPHDYWSWLTELLPYIDQGSLWHQADDWAQQNDSWKTGVAPFFWWPWGDYWNKWATAKPNPLLSEPVPNFVCPVDARLLVSHDIQGMHIAFTSYLGVSGTRGDLKSLPGKGGDGGIFWRSEVRLSAIVDGQSETILIGERPPSATFEYGWWFAGPGFDGSATGDVVLGTRDVGFAAALGCPDSYVGLQPGDL